MENEPTAVVPEPTATASTKERMSKKQIIGMTILSLIAIAGVAFGIFGMSDSNKQKQEIENLKVQITEATGNKTELETDKITITDPDGTTTEIVDSNTIKPSEYIYLSDWGIKLKIGEDLRMFRLEHLISNYDNQEFDAYTIEAVHPANMNLLSENRHDILGFPNNSIVRSKNATLRVMESEREPVYSNNGYNYFIVTPTGYSYERESGTSFTESEIKDLESAYHGMTEILQNSENYSNI